MHGKVTVYEGLEQGTPEWLQARCGVITGSIVGDLLTPSGKVANNATSRARLHDLLAQRLTGHVDAIFQTPDMARGVEEEPIARALYADKYGNVQEVGFVTRELTEGGVIIGCSPDGLVGDDGGIEIKSRRPKHQIATILSNYNVPDEHILQVQMCLLVTGREWWDYVSYCGGLPLAVIRVIPDEGLHKRIIEAVYAAEDELARMRDAFNSVVAHCGWMNTKRIATEITE
jgi:hypothetical protein